MEFIKVIVRNCLKSIFFTGRKPRNRSLLVLAPTRTGNGVGRVLFVQDLFLFSKENIESYLIVGPKNWKLYNLGKIVEIFSPGSASSTIGYIESL